MAYTSIAALIAGGIGALLFILGVVRLCRLRLANGCGHCLLGTLLLASGLTVGAVGANLHTYDRLTQERDVLEIEFTREGDQLYTATLRFPDSPQVERYRIRGDEWQLDARMLKWHGPAVIAGMDSHYRLERLSGRYSDIDQERGGERSVHPMGYDHGVDLWRIAREHDRFVPWVDAVYGSATYLPMQDGARYRVRVSQTGLLARPVDEDTRRITSDWR